MRYFISVMSHGPFPYTITYVWTMTWKLLTIRSSFAIAFCAGHTEVRQKLTSTWQWDQTFLFRGSSGFCYFLKNTVCDHDIWYYTRGQMASGPITSWEIDGQTVETVSDFIFLGSKITADGDCSHEIKRHLLLGRKVMTNLDSLFKSRDITLPTKVRLVKAMVFPVVMYGCESWTVKKAELRRIDAFELWCWRRLLRVPWTARLDCKEIQPVHPKGDQSWVFFGRTDAKAETSILWPPDVKSWLIWKRPWCSEGLGAGGEGDDRGWNVWMASPTRWTWVWVSSGSWWWTGRPGLLRFMGSQIIGHNWVTKLNWTERTNNPVSFTVRFQ